MHTKTVFVSDHVHRARERFAALVNISVSTCRPNDDSEITKRDRRLEMEMKLMLRRLAVMQMQIMGGLHLDAKDTT